MSTSRLPDGALPATVAGARVLLAPYPLEPRATAGPAVRLESIDGGSTLTVETVARFEVAADGAAVRVVPNWPVHPDLVRGWLHGSVAALILAHSGRMALHATTVDLNGVGVALCGPSGAGKSTTSLRLAQCGHPIVADDVSPIDVEDTDTGQVAVVTPFGRPLHVWPETVDRLGLDVSAARACFPGTDKLQMPAPQAAPIAVHNVVLLESADVAEPRMSRLRGAESILAVAQNIYRPGLIRSRWQADLMIWAAAVATCVSVHRLARPKGCWTVDAVVTELERLVSGRPPGTEHDGPETRHRQPAHPPVPQSAARA